MQPYHLLCTLLLLTAGPLCAQSVPEGGVALLPEDAALKMGLQGGTPARRTVVTVPDMPFAHAVQAETLAPSARSWDIQFSLNTTKPVSQGDVLLAVFWARGLKSSDETGEVYSEFIFERNGAPWTKSVSYPIVVVGQWRRFFVPFTCVENYGVAQASVKFRLGYRPQTLQIGDLVLLNYAQTRDITDLPRSSIVYGGMETNAPWRDRAEEMIDQYRKGDMTVTVRNSRGGPVADAVVRFRMNRHAYPFGSAVDARTLMRDDDHGQRYREVITTYFNRVVFENDLKWGPWETWDRQTTLSALRYLREHDIEIRGHCLVWPSWRHLPSDLEQNQGSVRYLKPRVLDHITDEAGALAGKLVDWDVINENYSNHDLMDILGDRAMVDWFKQTRAADPHATLYLNDYGIISGGGLDEAHRSHYLWTVQYLLDAEAPIGGLGTQCHFGANPTPPERIWRILDELDDFGLPVQCTEFDINADDSEYQVHYMRDFMTAYFAHPATQGILMWGFWAGKHWRPKSALWDEDWQLRPHGEVWVNLVTETWWTDETRVTDSAGRASVRGFFGDYTVWISVGDQTVTAEFEHGAGGTAVTVTGSEVVME